MKLKIITNNKKEYLIELKTKESINDFISNILKYEDEEFIYIDNISIRKKDIDFME